MTAPRKALAKGLILVGAATLVGNGAAYLLSMIAARQLTPEAFGAFGAMLSILIIISTLSMAIQALTARRVAVATGDRPEVEGQAIRLSVVIGFAIIGLGLVASWPLAPLFAIPYAALAMGFASVGFTVLGTAALGVAQGREAHTAFSWGFVVNGMGRAIGGIVLVLLFPTIIGVSAGLLLGCAIGAIGAYLLICPRRWASALAAGGTAEFGHIAHALIVLFTLTNVDMLLARYFLSEAESGEYSVGVLLAKIAFFLPNAIIIVLFPKMTAGDSRRTVFVATGLTAAMGVVITTFSLFFGDLVMRVLGGAQYVDLGLGSEAWLFALEGSAFALVQVLLYARLAAQDRRAVALVWVALVVQVAIIAIWRHSSLAEIVTTVVGVSLAVTVVGLFMDARTQAKQIGPDDPLVPIEAAE